MLLVLSFFFFKKINPPNDFNQPQQRTYENKTMGITFTYPSVLVQESGLTDGTYTVFFYGEEDKKLRTKGIIAEKPSNMIAIHYFTNRNYQEEVNRVISNIPKNRKIIDVTFKSYPAKEIVGNLEQFGITLNSKHIVVNKNGITYSLGVEWYSDTKLDNYFNQIIESLKFIR